MKEESEKKLNKCINYMDWAILAGLTGVVYFLITARDIGPVPVAVSIVFVGFLYGMKGVLKEIVEAEGVKES